MTSVEEAFFLSKMYVCLSVGYLTYQQQASESHGLICSDKRTYFYTEVEVADQAFYLTRSQYTDTRSTSPNADPISPGAWQGSHWSAKFEVTGMTRPGKNAQGASGNRAKRSISSSNSILTPNQPVPALTLYRQAPGWVTNGVPNLKSPV